MRFLLALALCVPSFAQSQSSPTAAFEGRQRGNSFAESAQLTALHLIGDGLVCEDLRSKYPEIKECNLKQRAPELPKSFYASVIQNRGVQLGKELKNQFFPIINKAFVSHFAAATWLQNQNPLRSNQASFLTQKYQAAAAKCAPEFNNQFERLEANLKNLDVLKELELQSLTTERRNQIRDVQLKRMLIAAIESNRLDRFIADRPLSDEQKSKLRDRQRLIRESYPLIGRSADAAVLIQRLGLDYRNIQNLDSTSAHPLIDEILFKNINRLPESSKLTSNLHTGNEGLINQVILNPLSENMISELQAMMNISLARSFESLGGFCELNPCQAMQLDLSTTADVINQLGEENNVATNAACSCNFSKPTRYYSEKLEYILVGTTLAGMVVCPFTFGVGCTVAQIAGSTMFVASGANTVGAIQDKRQTDPLSDVAKSLPGLSEDKRTRIESQKSMSDGLVLSGFANTVLFGYPPIATAQGYGKFVSKLFAKRAVNTEAKKITAESLFNSHQLQVAWLEKLGVKVKTRDFPGFLEREIKYRKSGIKEYELGNLDRDFYGELLDIEELPKAVAVGTPKTLTLIHPELKNYLQILKQHDVDLLIDTSLKSTHVAALFSVCGKLRFISIRPDSTWLDFIHEFQHSMFRAYVEPNIQNFRTAIKLQGKAFSDTEKEQLLKIYSEKELRRLEKLLKKGHTDIGIDETLSTDRELAALGWRRYLPSESFPRIYGATNRYSSLQELKNAGVVLSKEQSKALAQASDDLMLAKLYFHSPQYGKIIGSVLVIKIAYNQYQVRFVKEAYHQPQIDKLYVMDEEGNLYLLDRK